MVLKDNNEDKFIRNEIYLGLLNNDKKEVKASDYKRILLDINLFKKNEDNKDWKYTNKFAFGFPETFFNWGDIYYVAAFYNGDNEIIGIDHTGKKWIPRGTTVLFLDGQFNIDFK